ncbi:hypothetical protein SAMN05446037_102458 [Anaerovirgula multivorans]|uniref:Uncharacterized protein n=1 Tax=Anaerovirgula multivorans TaxID=312168 RepID=A0A239HXR2_9FIRM|nr:hypothetical protein [Anaerovirgula multivorans]SNS86190.1 hypothetical protein SAMN05446037_102458 [Anaerovirgula multivorans]
MKKIVVLFFIAILIIGHENIIFASYKNEEALNEEMKLHLQEVFSNRVNIWNTFITEGATLEDTKIQLKEYTTEPLIEVDFAIFQEIVENPTSYEVIKEVHIQNCEAIKVHGKESTFSVEILWVLETYEELVYEEVQYIVIMKKDKNKWLLSDYQLNR